MSEAACTISMAQAGSSAPRHAPNWAAASIVSTGRSRLPGASRL
jgi:hypothetical protein